MSELEDKISEVLGDPQQMARITRLAQSLMGGEGAEAAPTATNAAQNAEATATPALDALGIDAAMLSRLAKAISADSGQSRAEQTLLEAMRVYLSEKRRGKLERAMKLARLARIAKLTMKEAEEGNA